MTLFEAMKQVLIDNTSKALTAEEIARLINEKKLYCRADGKPVPASQINAYVRKYFVTFKKLDRYITI